jgi:hypothetical protein
MAMPSGSMMPHGLRRSGAGAAEQRGGVAINRSFFITHLLRKRDFVNLIRSGGPVPSE